MKINCINNVLTKTNFKSGTSDKAGFANKNFTKDESDKIKTGLAGLAVIGVAAVCSAALKKNNNKPYAALKENFFKKQEVDPILKKLDGKRDSDAVKLYNAMKAQEKSISLKQKMLNGEFNGKPNEVYGYLIKNEQKLERTTRAAM